MTTLIWTATCPSCRHCWDVPETPPVNPDALPWLLDENTCALECPCCGWEFVEFDGEWLDDGGLDAEGPFGVDDEGELSAETLLAVRCPHCTRVAEVAEDDALRCAGCRRTFWVEGGRVRRPECLSHPEIDPDDEGAWEEFCEHLGYCPHCNMDEMDGYTGTLVPARDGWVECVHCGEGFEDPVTYAELLADRGHETMPRRLERFAVAPEGSGDAPSLRHTHERVEMVGGRFLLRPGRHVTNLTAPGERLVLEGDGPPDAVVLAGKLRCHGGRVVLRGLTVEGEILASQTRMTLIDCTLRGARLAATGFRADVRLRRCRIEGAPADGILASYSARVRLRDCTITGGGGAGVRLSAGGWACLQDCRIAGNRGDGVCAERDTTAILRRCTVECNGGAGLRCAGRAVLRRCDFRGQQKEAIRAAERARVVAVGCRILDGSAAGVRLGDGARAVLHRCAVSAQARAGVTVAGRAQAVLSRCAVEGNGGPGVRLGRRARLSLRQGRCADNRGRDWAVAPGAAVRTRGA